MFVSSLPCSFLFVSRSCGQIGNFTHIPLNCLQLIYFWRYVEKEIKQMLGIDTMLNVLLDVCSIHPGNITNEKLIYVLRMIQLIAPLFYPFDLFSELKHLWYSMIFSLKGTFNILLLYFILLETYNLSQFVNLQHYFTCFK